MAEILRFVYYLSKHLGQFPHMLPYFKKCGGLVFCHNEKMIEQFKKEFSTIPITSDIYDVLNFNPDVMMYSDYYPIIKGLRAKNVMVFHGMELKGYYAIKKDWNKCEEYDLCLLYGDKILNEFKNNNWKIKYEIIGYPLFDEIEDMNNLPLNKDRKTILIAPTWGDLSLLEKFTDEIIKLSEVYNIIIKVHPITASFESRESSINLEKFKKLIKAQHESLLVCQNTYGMALMKKADMLITDYSSTSCEFMHFNKPIIITKPDCTFKQPDIWNVFKICEKPSELKQMIESQFKNDEMKEQRQKYFKQLVYDEENTTPTERGIAAIKRMIKKGETDD